MEDVFSLKSIVEAGLIQPNEYAALPRWGLILNDDGWKEYLRKLDDSFQGTTVEILVRKRTPERFPCFVHVTQSRHGDQSHVEFVFLYEAGLRHLLSMLKRRKP